MKKLNIDLIIIGGGPAGMAAATQANDNGLEKVLIIERDCELGGILQQCIHDGFGLISFKERLTGGQYAQRYINQVEAKGIQVKLNTMVLEITSDKKVYAVNEEDGLLEISAKAIILAMGCRERTRAQVFINGARPAGVFTAGAVQRYINMEGFLPGKKAVILGSGDIGLIMARRMTLEGIKVEGVYEIMKTEGGLTRNIEQCLNDYGIVLNLSTTITKIHGNKRVEGVTVSQVDASMKPIEGTDRYIECDMVVLSVGLIPENELSKNVGIELDSLTKGPIVDENMMTSIPGVFAAGNVVAVFDLVDYVSQTGVIAAKGAMKYINGTLDLTNTYISVNSGENVSVLIPQKIRKSNLDNKQDFFLRVREENEKMKLETEWSDKLVQAGKFSMVKPPEMIHITLGEKELAQFTDEDICFHMRKES
ncbi:MAG: pyridine nucleotide-disulfide oxidoreductase [Firmicutes bacterium HGW-Firmicutes-7]|nr:MAG: pyridine nucleotide-disulfide oxidoreductase [Firmicutes bacterium HGW-Firmicutes-7]